MEIKERLAGLDALRTLSIAMVIYQHLVFTEQFRNSNHKFIDFFISGDLGVHLFFVISGFLITHLLLNEEKHNGSINLKAFYIRRFFRIFPAYYFFLLVVFLLNKYVLSDLEIINIVPPLTYTTGFGESPGITVMHSWSLAVEEQYYLLYPLFLLLLINKRMRLMVLWSLIILIPLLRMLLYKFFFLQYTYTILYSGDCLLWGCILAFYKENFTHYFEARKKILYFFLFIILFINFLLKYSSENHLFGYVTIPLTNTSNAILGIGLITLLTLVPNKSSIRFQIINSKIIFWLGTLSYSIYLWQQFVIPMVPSTQIWKTFPLSILTILLIATASYFIIEKPFLILRRRFDQSKLINR